MPYIHRHVTHRTLACGPLLVIMLLACIGCTTTLESSPPRTAHEQLMLSRAVRDSMADWYIPSLANQRVYLDTQHLELIDRGYVVGEMRDWIGRQDAIVVDDEADAEIRLELRSAGLGLEAREQLIGIPSFGLPIPGAAPLQTPELALYKDRRRKGVAALALTAFDTGSGRRLLGDEPHIGQTYHRESFVLFIPWHKSRHNLPPEVEITAPQPRGK